MSPYLGQLPGVEQLEKYSTRQLLSRSRYHHNRCCHVTQVEDTDRSFIAIVYHFEGKETKDSGERRLPTNCCSISDPQVPVCTSPPCDWEGLRNLRRNQSSPGKT